MTRCLKDKSELENLMNFNKLALGMSAVSKGISKTESVT